MIIEFGVEGVVLVFGDWYFVGFYMCEDVIDYLLYEIILFVLNMFYCDENNEFGFNWIGDMYVFVNFGVILVDWNNWSLFLEICDDVGQIVCQQCVELDDFMCN